MAPRPTPVQMPATYGIKAVPGERLPWDEVERWLTASRNYWIATTRPDGRPHARPVWGIWLDNAFYFSTGSMAAGNLARSAEITVHVESAAGEAVIIEGVAAALSSKPRTRAVIALYNEKYHWD